MIAVFGKDHAGTSGHSAYEAELRREIEFPPPRRRRVADGITKVSGLKTEFVLNDSAPLAHLVQCVGSIQLRKARMRRRMRANRRKFMTREFPQAAPFEAKTPCQFGGFDGRRVAQLLGYAKEFVLRARAKQPIKRRESLHFLGSAATLALENPASGRNIYMIELADRLLHLDPPHSGGAIRESRRDISDEWGALALKDWEGVLVEISVTIVKGEDDERIIVPALASKSFERVIERDDIVATLA